MKRILSMLFLLLIYKSVIAQYVLVPDSALRWILRANVPAAFSGNYMDTTNAQLQAVTNINYYAAVPMYNFDGLQYLHGITNLSITNIGADSATFFPPNAGTITLKANTLKRIYNVPNSVWTFNLQGNSPLNYIDISSYTNNISIKFDLTNAIGSRKLVADFHTGYYTTRNITMNCVLADTVVLNGSALRFRISGKVDEVLDLSAIVTNDLSHLTDCNILLLPALCQSLYSYGTVDSINALPSNLTSLKLDYGNDDGFKIKKGLPPTVQTFEANSYSMGELDSIPASIRNFNCSDCQLSRLPELPDSLLTLEIPYNYLSCYPWLPDGLIDFVYQPQYLANNTIAPFYCLPNWPLPWAYNHPNGFIGCPPSLTNCGTISAIVGKVFRDLDSNGIKDPAEPYLSSVKMKTIRSGSAFEYISVTNDSGRYFQYAIPGLHTVEPVLPKYGSLSTAAGNCTITNLGDTISLPNIGIKFLSNINDLALSAVVSPLPRPGFNSTLYITCVNNGTKVSNGSVHFDIDPAFNINSESPAADTASGQSRAWDLTGMLPGAVFTATVSLTCLPSTPINSSVIIDGVAYPVSIDTFPPDNFKHLILEVRGSWDPNDKQVVPAGNFTPVQVSQGEYLDYTIRFQNTGTAEAVHVEIADSLSSFFDVPSLEVVSTSHQPYTWRIQENTLIVRFDSIMLPDSNANEVLSHGFVQYRVKPLSSVQLGDIIENNADIYFDFNSPVRTNTTGTTIGWPTGVNENSENASLLLYPNPARSSESIVYLARKHAEPLLVQWNDQTGRLISSERIPAFSNTVRLPVLSPGIYLIKLTGDSLGVNVIKVVITK